MKFKVKTKDNVVRLPCPDCRKLFYSISSLNKHIAHSGHNESVRFTEMDVLKFVFKMKIKKNQIVLSIPS